MVYLSLIKINKMLVIQIQKALDNIIKLIDPSIDSFSQDSFKKLTEEQKQMKIEDIRQEKLQQIKLIRKYVIFTAASGLNTMGKKVPMPPDPDKIK